MELLVDILIWLHFMAIAAGGAATFGIPVVGRNMASATAEMRPTLLAIMKGLSTLGRIGLGTLIVTGPLIIWLKYGGASGFNVWFWVKMVLVVALLAGVIYAGINLKRSMSGDEAAGRRSPQIGMINTALFVAIVATAVLAF
jgi:protoporphyrinogen IX oxidase